MPSVSKPTIYNVTLSATPSTEGSRALPSFCRGVSIFVRPAADGSVADLQIAFTSGESATNYLSVIGGYMAVPFPPGHHAAGTLTIYMQSPTASAVVEILAWT